LNDISRNTSGKKWMIPFLNEVIAAKSNNIIFAGIDQAELHDIISFICTA